MQPFSKSYDSFETKSNAFIVKVERDRNVEPRNFPGSKYLNYYVRIFIELDRSALSRLQNAYYLDDISLVKYELHRSYIEPVRTSSDQRNNFELKVWTYGFYPIKATIYLKSGNSITIPGEVKFEVSDEEKKRNAGEME